MLKQNVNIIRFPLSYVLSKNKYQILIIRPELKREKLLILHLATFCLMVFYVLYNFLIKLASLYQTISRTKQLTLTIFAIKIIMPQ